MPLMTTALTNVSHRAATMVTQFTLFIRSGLRINRVALAAGIMADTINTQQSTSSAHPAKKPGMRPRTMDTHAYEVPALAMARFRWMKANVMPNIASPQTRMLAGASVPAVPISVEVVISML